MASARCGASSPLRCWRRLSRKSPPSSPNSGWRIGRSRASRCVITTAASNCDQAGGGTEISYTISADNRIPGAAAVIARGLLFLFKRQVNRAG